MFVQVVQVRVWHIRHLERHDFWLTFGLVFMLFHDKATRYTKSGIEGTQRNFFPCAATVWGSSKKTSE